MNIENWAINSLKNTPKILAQNVHKAIQGNAIIPEGYFFETIPEMISWILIYIKFKNKYNISSSIVISWDLYLSDLSQCLVPFRITPMRFQDLDVSVIALSGDAWTGIRFFRYFPARKWCFWNAGILGKSGKKCWELQFLPKNQRLDPPRERWMTLFFAGVQKNNNFWGVRLLGARNKK